MFTFGSAASKDDGVNGDTLRGLPGWVYDGALASRGTKARIGMCTGLLVTWQSKYKYYHFQGHVHPQYTETFADTLAQFLFASSAPHNLGLEVGEEQGEGSQDVSPEDQVIYP